SRALLVDIEGHGACPFQPRGPADVADRSSAQRADPVILRSISTPAYSRGARQGARRCQEAVRNPGTETMTGGEALVTSKIPRVSYPDTWSGLSGRVKMYVRMWAPSGDQTGAPPPGTDESGRRSDPSGRITYTPSASLDVRPKASMVPSGDHWGS